jgi:hypothetical protein
MIISIGIEFEAKHPKQSCRDGCLRPPSQEPASRGEKVFEVRWDKAGGLKVVQYDQGDWERTLRAWPAPIPFK